ncbi:MAG TPA: hypothetical protein PKK06_16765 [Phycisphaerae bacterium]|nr:hypothetical protein [Phycisphaerae bacterium]HNU46840.1 hypothetical protein [Phycisphaerae bacterium]
MPSMRRVRDRESEPVTIVAPPSRSLRRGHGPQQPVKQPPFGADRLRQVLGASTDVPLAELCETAASEVERLRRLLDSGARGRGV